MAIETIKKVTSSTGSLPPTLLDLTNDTVNSENLSKDETAHNNEGYPITGQMSIEEAEAWAVGTKNGVPVAETDIQYQNNSKYYSIVSGSIMRVAGQQAIAAATSANNAASSASEAADSAVISGSCMRTAGEYKDEAVSSASTAEEKAEDAEAWAVGKRNGTDVTPSDPTYHNNSKYWADQAKAYGTGGVHYIASVLFENIPVSGMASGDMYNIEDDFTTDERFQEGAGVKVKAGANIIYNAYGKWDVEATGGGNDDLIANTENGNTATHAYTKGQQFIKEDKLYKAVKDIAVGDVLAPAIPVNPVSFTLEQADYITKMRVYSSATDYIDYFPSGRRFENITLYTNQRVVLYHSASSKWGYIFVNPYRYVGLEVGETSYFIVPNNATGDSATIMQRAEEPATGISVDNFTIGESTFLGTYGWVKDVTGLVMGEGSPIENGNYVESEKITDQIQIFKGVNGSIASVSGLVPPAQEAGKFFRSDGAWADLPIFQGVSGSVQSVSGLLPQAQPGDENKAFFGDGTYKTVETEDTNFEGTLEAFNALPEEEKAKYKTRDLRGDFNGMPIDEDLDSSSNHPVENQAIAKNIEAVVNVYGSKNLLNNVAVTSVDKSVTFTVNSDGSVTVNGTATGGDAQLNINTAVNLPEGHYIVTGRPQNAAGSYIAIKSGNNWLADTGEGVTVDGAISQIVIVVQNTYNINNLTFYPMIRDSRITDPTYVPYAMTNRELTESINVLNNKMINSPSPYINTSTIAYLAEKLISYMANMDAGVYIAANGWAQHSEGYHAICIKSYYNDSTSNPVYSGTVYEYANMKVYAFTSRGSTIKTTELN